MNEVTESAKQVTKSIRQLEWDKEQLERKCEKLNNLIYILRYAFPSDLLTNYEKYGIVDEMSEKINVNTICEALELSKGSYYNYLYRNKKENTVYAKHRKEISPLVEQIFNDTGRILGAKKISAIIKEKGFSASPELVSSIMRELDLCSQRQSAKSEYKKQLALKRNILKRQFNVSRPNEVWVGDVTFFNVKHKKLYICAIMDLYARKIIAYRISTKNSTRLTKETFLKAYESRQPTDDLLFHSDRGSNYTSRTYMTCLQEHNVTQSFSMPGVPYDNSVMETFFKSLKSELLYRIDFNSENHFKEKVADYIHFYNHERPHKTNGYKTPDSKEKAYFADKSKTGYGSDL
ncbi:MAG: IS3 family transposase [Ruminococcus sp.]|nr:IS3 family transposase [Ruminococcus sp.]